MSVSVRDIMELIGQEIANSANSKLPEKFSERFHPFDFYRDIYNISEFNADTEREFIHLVYGAILKRSPDPEGLASGLWRLESGESMISELQRIRYSPEGEQQGVHIKGLKLANLLDQYRHVPLIRAFAGRVGLQLTLAV